MNVTIKISNGGILGKTIQIPFKTDTNVQEALEIAHNQEVKAGRKFDFAVQYYGDALGYMLIMIDKVYDNPTNPNDYWEFIVNGKPAIVGIDNYMTNAGDIISFDYVLYAPHKTHLKSKHEFYTQ